MESFKDDFLQFSSEIVKKCFLKTGWSLSFNSKYFKNLLEIFLISKFYIHFIVIIEDHFTCSEGKMSSNVKDFQHALSKIVVYLIFLIDKKNRTKKKKRKEKPGSRLKD